MLMHADNGGVDHLDSDIMGRGKCVYDAAPDTSPPSTDEAVVARGVWTKRLGQITPGCSGSQDPEDAIEDTTVVYPRNVTRLVRQHRLDGNPFIISEFVAHDSSPQFGSLNHGSPAKCNASGSAPVRRLRAEADINLPTIPDESVENDPHVWSGRAVQEVLSIRQIRSCINVSGLCLEGLLRAIMDISAHAI